MAYEEITSPIALDESFNTTENTSRNIADVLADELSNLADAVKPDAGDIALDTISGMSANNVQDGIEELKGTLDSKGDCVSLLTTNQAISTTPTSFSLSDDFTKYKLLIIEFLQYSNVWESKTVPVSYFNVTDQNKNVQFMQYDSGATGRYCVVYKDTTSAVKVTAVRANLGSEYHIRIYGVK